MKFIIRWAFNTVALYVAIILLRPTYIQYTGNWVDIIWLALIFGLVNAILRPPFKALSCLLIILTFGLFTLVINTLLFAMTFWIAGQMHILISLGSQWFLSAFLGGLITSLISGILNGVFRENHRNHKSHI